MQHPVLAPTAAGCPCAGTVPWPPSWDGRSLCKTRRFPRQERVDGLKMSSSILAALESRAVTLPKHPGSDVREPEAVLPEPRQTPARQRWLWGRYRTCATVCQSHGRSHSVLTCLGAPGQGGIPGTHGEKGLIASLAPPGARYVPRAGADRHAGCTLFARNLRQF